MTLTIESLLHRLHSDSTYTQYKRDTRVIATWLARSAIALGYTPSSLRSAKKNLKKKQGKKMKNRKSPAESPTQPVNSPSTQQAENKEQSGPNDPTVGQLEEEGEGFEGRGEHVTFAASRQHPLHSTPHSASGVS